MTHKNIEGEIFVPSDKNALLIGPVTVGAAATIDVAVGSVPGHSLNIEKDYIKE